MENQKLNSRPFRRRFFCQIVRLPSPPSSLSLSLSLYLLTANEETKIPVRVLDDAQGGKAKIESTLKQRQDTEKKEDGEREREKGTERRGWVGHDCRRHPGVAGKDDAEDAGRRSRRRRRRRFECCKRITLRGRTKTTNPVILFQSHRWTVVRRANVPLLLINFCLPGGSQRIQEGRGGGEEGQRRRRARLEEDKGRSTAC